MERQLPPPAKKAAVPQLVIFVIAALFCCLVYALAAGAGSGRYLETDRMVVAECWKSIDRRATSDADRRELTEACARMERGFQLKHGATL